MSRFSLVCLAGAIGGLFLWLYLWSKSPWYTGQQDPVDQPVQFDHRHHVADDGIDCRYCHTTVETAASAGIPATSVCMSCHAQIWNKSALTGILRASYFGDRPIPWNRVDRLPDFVYFNHSIHVAKGIGCVSCHGRIDQMAQVTKHSSLMMGWCLDCHRDPEPNLRPRQYITSMTWKPERNLGPELAVAYGLHTRTSCTTCHR